jgi:hypothetical protein
MKTLFRLVTLSLGLVVLLSLDAVGPNLTEVRAADTGGGWVACTDGTTNPGDRSGCTVTFTGYLLTGGGGFYKYDCPGTDRDVECLYMYNLNE